MIYYFLTSQYENSDLFSFSLQSVLLRFFLAFFISFFIGLILARYLIPYIKNFQSYGQPIRDIGPESHKNKAGTPNMGGLIIIFAIIISNLLIVDFTCNLVLISLATLIAFGFLGFLDDYYKISKNDHHGVKPRFKLLLQFLIALPICYLIIFNTGEQADTSLHFPIFKGFVIDLSYLYIFFAALVIISASNAVNLTDGLDGLAIVPVSLVALCVGIMAYVAGNFEYASLLRTAYVENASELFILTATVVGAGMAFLWYNAIPASIFMGDTGSIALGALLGVLSVIIKQELMLIITGMLFVIETLSVMVQVYYFKATGGKRIFKMSPLHHHFEQSGWSESKVVIRFWILSLLFALFGIALFLL